MKNAICNLDNVVLVRLDIHTWTGRKKLRPEDIKGQIPPKELASLGSKNIVDPKRISAFDTIKRRSERMLQAIGIRLMGGYAIPVDKIDEVVDLLEAYRDEYFLNKKSFLSSYQLEVDRWVEEQGEWGEIIRGAVTPVSYIQDQLDFDWVMYNIQPTGVANLDDRFDKQVGGMASQLFLEITKESERILEKSFLLKTSVRQKSLNAVRAMMEKLEGLSFLDQKAGAIAGVLSEVLESVSSLTVIENKELNKIVCLLTILSNKQRIEAFGQAILDNNQSIAGFGMFIQGGAQSSVFSDEDDADDAAVVVDSFVEEQGELVLSSESIGDESDSDPSEEEFQQPVVANTEPVAWF